MIQSKRAAIAAVLVLLGFAWSAFVSGPVPGDIAIVRAFQRLLGTEPGWAHWLTAAAKFPYAWVTVTLAAAGAFLLCGWRGAVAAGAAFALALGLDKLLRLVVHAPRPSPELVAVASPASSSGLPSTFGLVFGALFGLTLLVGVGQRRPGATAVVLLSSALLAGGFVARVVLGGHWPSQMLLSLAFGVLAASMLRGLAGQTRAKKRKRGWIGGPQR